MDKMLRGFDMTMEQFIDLCILLGCDYCPTVRGIGPKKAFDLISQHKSIEAILENLDQTVSFLEYMENVHENFISCFD